MIILNSTFSLPRKSFRSFICTNTMVLDVPNPPQTQSEMTGHLLAKSGEKIHFCSECEESFNQAGNLNSHMATHIREKNVTCVQCNRQFGQARNLKRHLLIHSEVKKSFGEAGVLRKHKII